MKEDIAIKVHDLHKSFDLPENKTTSLKQLFVGFGKKQRKHRQKVLEGVDFEVKKGEFFGIVGRNGSGKSTLLKILAGVYAPDKGGVVINGNVTPFIELGVGFNPELSGKDNVYLSASLLGYSRKQVDAMYDEIVDFAELHDHMDKKLKNYSSGMQVRLAFSIAIKAKNDILIFDEVLAVGDEAFQKKCMRIFEEYRLNKQTVILVTHSMDNVRRLCTRALMLSDGKIELIGSVKRVANAYSKSNLEPVSADTQTIQPQEDLDKIQLSGCDTTYNPGDVLNVKIAWPKIKGVKMAGVAIVRSNGEYVFGTNTGDIVLKNNQIYYSVDLDLGPGAYFLRVAVYDKTGKCIAFNESKCRFLIHDDLRKDVGGQVRLRHNYSNSEIETVTDEH
ncbi:ABC transporter ATP-binding protein [Candidatus Saccharibacteria bacterium]|nr:ABC transporter ATP-binding protein [Candidatus Saccharibacteria bacterium]